MKLFRRGPASRSDGVGLRRLTAGLRLALAGAVMALCQPGAPALADVGFDRPGHDYSKFVVPSADPAACALRCESDARCHAWAFSYPSTERAEAVCWLKNAVPRPVHNPCCVSGVRGAAVNAHRSHDVEFGIDRAGGDYKTIDTEPDANGAPCAAACKGEQHCRAWTYVRPGYQGAAARCHLKARITPPRREPCCLSGVVR